MKVLYVRISSVDQNTDRQRVNEKEYDLVIEDKCSGSIPFFERPGGMKIMEIIKKNSLTTLSVWQIDRLGRDLRDIINTIHFFTERNIPIHFVSQSLKTLDVNGKENPITKMIISVLGVVGEMERNQIKERQYEGIQLAKLRGVYKGRKKNSKEDTLTFLSKPKNKKSLDLLKKGYKKGEVCKIIGIHPNTLSKVVKLGMAG